MFLYILELSKINYSFRTTIPTTAKVALRFKDKYVCLMCILFL